MMLRKGNRRIDFDCTIIEHPYRLVYTLKGPNRNLYGLSAATYGRILNTATRIGWEVNDWRTVVNAQATA